MSQLSSLTIPSALIEIGGSNLKLQGLQPTHLGWLYVSNKEVCDLLWKKYQTVADITALGVMAVSDFLSAAPVLAAHVIAMSMGSLPTDETWGSDIAKCLTFPISKQVECLQKIAALTFTKELPPKKLLEMFVAVIKQSNTTQ